MRSNPKYTGLTLIAVFILSVSVFGQVSLPRLISNGMVLQRDAVVKIWGRAAIHEHVVVSFQDSAYETNAGNTGEWEVKLPGMKAGGPYTMVIEASNTITIRDIVIGDVWICSGQSNMELNMKRASPLYESEIAASENNLIRYFAVPQLCNFKNQQKELSSGEWKSANPETVLGFSATAYFFAKALYDQYRVPVGLINASVGGSPAEAWMSEEALKVFPEYFEELQRFKDSTLIMQIEDRDRIRIRNWYDQLRKKDEGYKSPDRFWTEPSLNTADWASMKIPGYWADSQLGAVNGVVWFRKVIDVPASMVGKQAKLNLGRIVDADSVFINGIFAGSTSYQYPPRRYDIPPNLLKEGRNTIVVRVISNSGNGGFVLDKPYEIVTDGQRIDLKGDWQYRLGALMNPLESQTFIRWKPAGLFNAMISPLLNYSIKGVIWYQGEANADRALEYQKLFPSLINDWRNKWGQGNFPFLYVQLPNYKETKALPSESNWALLREAQLKALSLPKTGMAVAIDIGEWNDIHPLNKKDVGNRLAVAARKVAYGDEQVVYSGPVYKCMKTRGKKLILEFENIGSGLTSKGEKPAYFAIAGADHQFVWGNARIKHDQVIVWNNTIKNPVAVRYAWADNPAGANLYNREGLPASPFRTDE